MNILVNQSAFLGDLLLTTPLLRQVREKYPKAKVSLICRQGLGSLICQLELADEALEWSKKNSWSFRKVSKIALSRCWDLAFSPHYSFRSHILMGRLIAREKYGFSTWWNRVCYTSTIKRPKKYPDVIRQLALWTLNDDSFRMVYSSYLDAGENMNSTRLESFCDPIDIPPWASMNFASKIKGVPKIPVDRNTIFLAPGSVWKTKRWPEKSFYELAKLIIKNGGHPIFVGGEAERSLCQDLADRLKVEHLAGKTSLYDSLIHMKFGGGLISNDSGAMHMGAIAGLPVLGLFGPTVLSLGFKPWTKFSAVSQIPLRCRPCGKHGHQQCPLRTHECMEALSVKSVWNRWLELKKLSQLSG